MATVASERLDEMQDPELTIERAMTDYRRLGYSEAWINQRLKSIEVRKELTDGVETMWRNYSAVCIAYRYSYNVLVWEVNTKL